MPSAELKRAGPPASARPADVLPRLACPTCVRPLGADLTCAKCGATYSEARTVVDLRPAGLGDRFDVRDWTEHWSDDKQDTFAQRFFSFYRKAVFARTVRHFVDGYLPRQGVLVEAGSGTSETSMRIRKDAGRTLVALDLIGAVLEHCHPVMDVRMAGDIMRMPFLDDSVDGIWNVGVMEHFTHDVIDQMLREFRRVLRPGGRLVLLWPGTDSPPQKLLRLIERIANSRGRQPPLRFHPDEISQLHSVAEGRAVLERNGFDMVAADAGPRSLFAFKIVVGQKRVDTQFNGTRGEA